MSSIYRKCTRFAIAFSYDGEKEENYTDACDAINDLSQNALKNTSIWNSIDYAERDSEFFSYVQKYISRNSAYSNENIGSAWKLNKDLNKTSRWDGTVEVDQKKYCFLIEIAGLFLFRTGIGIFWYEIRTDDVDLDTAIIINSRLKNVSHSTDDLHLIHTTINTIEDICQESNISTTSGPGFIKVINQPGQFVHQENLKVKGNIRKIYCKQRNNQSVYCAELLTNTEASFKNFIDEMLAPLKIQTFFTDQISSSTNLKFKPDKSYVFSSVILNANENLNDLKVKHYLFWLNRGYKQSYLPPTEENLNDIYRPFDNSYWAASLEGCANIVMLTNNTQKTDLFFKENYWDRWEIYFYLYILVLHQYYALLNISSNVARLPININEYQRTGSNEATILNKYNETINFFYMKVYATQVSHISHQNELYAYMIKQFGIQTTVKEMRETLQVVNEMVHNLRQDKIARAFRAFAIVGGIFAFIETVVNLVNIYQIEDLGLNGLLTIRSFVSVAILITILLGYILWTLFNTYDR